MIYSIYHKDFAFIQNKTHCPIKVGPNTKNFLKDVGLTDDTGENIADKNPLFAELTAFYWVWKNVKLREHDFIGFSHYRRHFSFQNSFLKQTIPIGVNDLQRYLSPDDENKICTFLKKHQIITTKPLRLRRITVAEHYKLGHISDDWDIMIGVLNEMYPEYAKTANRIFNKLLGKLYRFNMFILSSNEYSNYMEWLFPLLFEIERRINITKYPYQSRVIGFIAERLLTLYIIHNRMRVKALPVLSVEL